MQNTIVSFNKQFESNYGLFLMESTDNILYEEQSSDSLPQRAIAVYELKNTKMPRSPTLGQRVSQGLCIVQIDIFAEDGLLEGQSLTGKAICRKIRDRIFDYFGQEFGKTIQRTDWGAAEPTPSGTIRILWQDDQPFEMDARKAAWSMTYHLEWEKPI